FEAVQAAKRSTVRVPIIMTPAADPVAAEIIDSLDRPGGNITGITEMTPELAPRRLELLRQIVRTLSRVGIMWTPGTLSEKTFRQMLTTRRCGIASAKPCASSATSKDRASTTNTATARAYPTASRP